VNVEVRPTCGPLPAVKLLERGAVTSIRGRAYAYGNDPQLADRIRSAATSALVRADVNTEIIDITRTFERATSEPPNEQAAGLVLWAETENGCVLGSSSAGLAVPNPRMIGRDAVRKLLQNMQHNGCVDEHLQVGACGEYHSHELNTHRHCPGPNDHLPCIGCRKISYTHWSAHWAYQVRTIDILCDMVLTDICCYRTAMWVAEQLTGAKFIVTADDLSQASLTISCEGIGYNISSSSSSSPSYSYNYE
jgi:hypothetical protein